jgi:diacylglycerol kinase (ATP)
VPIVYVYPHLVVIGILKNPRSGRGVNNAKWPEIEAKLGRALPADELRIEVTQGPGTAKSQAANLIDQGCRIIVAAGGDGTVSSVMEGVLGTDAALAVLPLGTGNDFSRSIGVGPNIDSAIDALAERKVKRIDVGRWQQGGRCGHFVNVAGCGFDAAVADRVNTGYRRLRGRSAYLAGILQCLFKFRSSNLSLVVDGELVYGRAMLCAFANARSYGGGMQIAPTADLTDGWLDLVLVGELGRVEFLWSFPRLLKGTHLSHPKVSHRLFRHLEVLSDPPVPILVDGELLRPGPLTVEVVPSALNVVVGY